MTVSCPIPGTSTRRRSGAGVEDSSGQERSGASSLCLQRSGTASSRPHLSLSSSLMRMDSKLYRRVTNQIITISFFSEFVLNEKDVYPYNCEKKEDFIRKGLGKKFLSFMHKS